MQGYISEDVFNVSIRVHLTNLPLGFEVFDDWSRGLLVGEKSLADGIFVVVATTTGLAALQQSRQHHLLVYIYTG